MNIWIISVFLIIGSSYFHCDVKASPNTDDLVSEVFGNPPENRGNENVIESCSQDGIEGECVPYYLCSNESKILTGGEGVIDIRFNEDRPCKDYLTTCCFPEDHLAEERKPVIPATGCGVRNFEGLGFRIQGAKDMESEFGEFPWMTALLVEEEALGKLVKVYKCGASLIAPNVVLTGAHCVHDKDPQKLIVRLGEWDTQTSNELFNHVDITVSRKIVHENFHPKALYNNVALLILSEPAKLGENIGVICLPPQGQSFDGQRCTVSGWGKDNFGKEGKYQVIMKKIDLPMVPHAQCQSALRQTRLGRHFKLHESFNCAGGEPGKDACRGDGGGPLICPVAGDPKRYYQAGIVSWGIGCGETGVPGVYANVASFRNWIDSQLQSIDTQSYVYQ